MSTISLRASTSDRFQQSKECYQQKAWSPSRGGNWSDARDLETISLKLLLVGSSGVGKTSLLMRFCDNVFEQAFISTVGVDFRTKTVRRGDRRVKLQVWDTAGQERYRAIAKQCFRGAAGFLVCYDISQRETFESIKTWCEDVKENSTGSAQIMVVATKADLSHNERMVSTHEGASFASEHGYTFLETSSKDNEGVQASFNALTDRILDLVDTAGTMKVGVEILQPGRELSYGETKKCLC